MKVNNLSEFSTKEFDKILNEIYKDLTYRKSTNKSPKAILLGGQPGAGKSSLTSKYKEDFGGNAVIVNGDSFRKLHPNFNEIYKAYGDDYVQHTAAFSGKMTEALIQKCSSNGYNLIIEGTLRNPDTQLNTGKLLKQRGYEVNLAVMAVPPTMSYFGTLDRYEKMQIGGTIPRATTKAQHDQTVNLLVNNIGKVFEAKQFDNILLFNREGKCLYDQKRTPELNPREVMAHEHNRPLTKEEMAQCQRDFRGIHKGMVARKDDRLKEFVAYCSEMGLLENGNRRKEGTLESYMLQIGSMKSRDKVSGNNIPHRSHSMDHRTDQ